MLTELHGAPGHVPLADGAAPLWRGQRWARPQEPPAPTAPSAIPAEGMACQQECP